MAESTGPLVKAPALSSYHMCIDWTEGDPALESLRVHAEEQIKALGK